MPCNVAKSCKFENEVAAFLQLVDVRCLIDCSAHRYHGNTHTQAHVRCQNLPNTGPGMCCSGITSHAGQLWHRWQCTIRVGLIPEDTSGAVQLHAELFNSVMPSHRRR